MRAGGCSNHVGSANEKTIGLMSIVFLFVLSKDDSNMKMHERGQTVLRTVWQ